MPPKNKLTPDQRTQIIDRAGQGMTPKDIGKELSIDPLRVSGCISYAVRQGQLPGSAEGTRRPAPKPPPAGPFTTTKAPQPQSEASMIPSSAPTPASTPTTSAPDDQGWRTAGQGSGYGFTHPTQALEFKLERIEPRDGVLEVSQSEPEDDEIGKRFGSGTYRLWRREGTKLPVFRDIVISMAYGESRYPNRRPDPQNRPQSRFLGGRNEQQEDDDRLPPRPFYRPQMDVRSYQPDNRSMADVARSGLTAQESIAVTAVKALTDINEKQMERMEKQQDREREPQSIVTDFLKEQQAAADRREAQERARREEERKEERAERDRRETEREAAHRRDMERMKLESDARLAQEREARQTMMELEKQKMEILREENRAREAALKAELEKIRTEAKEERATLLAQITKIEEKSEEQADEVQETIKEELEKGRTSLTREFDLKEQHLQNEQKLKEDMLKLREELVKGQQNEDISKVLTKLVEGIERTVKEVVDLKKIEAVSSEERLAKVGQSGTSPQGTGAANVPPASGQATPKPTEQPAAMQGQKTGNGHAGPTQQQAEAAAPGQDQTPEMMVRQLAREPVFINMISKWAKQLQAGNDAGVFSNMFMELMRDDGTVEALKIRKACSYFVDEMSTKSWAEMYDFLKPAIPQNLYPIFESPHAEVFYNQFKMMVVESVRDYWKLYFAQKQAEIEAAKQGGVQVAPPQQPEQQQPEQQPEQQPQAGPVIPAAPVLQAEAPAEEPKPEVTVSAA